MIKITIIILQSDARIEDGSCLDVYVPSVPTKGDRFRMGSSPEKEFTVQEVRFVEDLESEFSIQVDLLADGVA